MSDPRWTDVDRYIEGKLLGRDDVLDAVLADNEAGGLPAIDVSPVQGASCTCSRSQGGRGVSSRWAHSAAIRRSSWRAGSPRTDAW